LNVVGLTIRELFTFTSPHIFVSTRTLVLALQFTLTDGRTRSLFDTMPFIRTQALQFVAAGNRTTSNRTWKKSENKKLSGFERNYELYSRDNFPGSFYEGL
jgi:hypothetical protein